MASRIPVEAACSREGAAAMTQLSGSRLVVVSKGGSNRGKFRRSTAASIRGSRLAMSTVQQNRVSQNRPCKALAARCFGSGAER